MNYIQRTCFSSQSLFVVSVRRCARVIGFIVIIIIAKLLNQYYTKTRTRCARNGKIFIRWEVKENIGYENTENRTAASSHFRYRM